MDDQTRSLAPHHSVNNEVHSLCKTYTRVDTTRLFCLHLRDTTSTNEYREGREWYGTEQRHSERLRVRHADTATVGVTERAWVRLA